MHRKHCPADAAVSVRCVDSFRVSVGLKKSLNMPLCKLSLKFRKLWDFN